MRLFRSAAQAVIRTTRWIWPVLPVSRGLAALADADESAAGLTRNNRDLARLMGSWLIWSAVLLIVAAAGTVALLRLSRRLRQRLIPTRRKSDTSDLWSQYRLPADWDQHEPDTQSDRSGEPD